MLSVRSPAPSQMVRFRSVRKSYGGAGEPIVRDLSLDVATGEFLTLLGPSGSGKSTALLMLAGFERPDAGEILLDGRSVTDTPPHRRGIGVVMQQPSLFPHRTVARNVAFPLQIRGLGRAEQSLRVDRALDMVRMKGAAERLPSQLSIGQQQLTALARALVFSPQLVLLDDPFRGLDRSRREELQLDLRHLHERLGVTMLHVTRDHAEALTVSERVAVFAAGEVQQLGTPQALYDAPANAFVAGFLGENNRLPGVVREVEDDAALVGLDCGPMVEATAVGVGAGEPCVVMVRPERVAVAAVAADELGSGALPATLLEVIFRGDHTRLRLRLGTPLAPLSAEIMVKRPAGAPLAGLAPGRPAALAWQPRHAAAFAVDEINEHRRT